MILKDNYSSVFLPSMIILCVLLISISLVLWPSLELQYYVNMYKSENYNSKVFAIDQLFGMGQTGQIAIANFINDENSFILIKQYWNNINKRTDSNTTPLREAIRINNLNTIKLFLAKGANVNEDTYSGDKVKGIYHMPPLHIAVLNRQIQIASLLLRYGADVNKQDIGLNTPLHYAVENGDEKAVELLMKYHAKTNIANLQDKIPAQLTNSIIIKKLLN